MYKSTLPINCRGMRVEIKESTWHASTKWHLLRGTNIHAASCLHQRAESKAQKAALVTNLHQEAHEGALLGRHQHTGADWHRLLRLCSEVSKHLPEGNLPFVRAQSDWRLEHQIPQLAAGGWIPPSVCRRAFTIARAGLGLLPAARGCAAAGSRAVGRPCAWQPAPFWAAPLPMLRWAALCRRLHGIGACGEAVLEVQSWIVRPCHIAPGLVSTMNIARNMQAMAAGNICDCSPDRQAMPVRSCGASQ